MAETKDIGMSRPPETNGFRTHEPALRELTAELDGFKDLMEERDKWYQKRYTEDKEAALVSQKMRDDTLALQAKEYERRLEGLNHENARIITAANLSVSRELFDARIIPLESYVTLAQGRGAGARDNRAAIAWVLAAIMALITIGGFVFRAKPDATPAVFYAPMQPGTLVPLPQTPAVPK